MESVAKVVELTSVSKKSFEDAITKGIARASKTIDGITGAWIQDQKIDIKKGKIEAFRCDRRTAVGLPLPLQHDGQAVGDHVQEAADHQPQQRARAGE